MNPTRDMEPILDRWFDEGPTRAPDRVLGIMAGRIGQQRQRPAWRVDLRAPNLSGPLRLAAIAAALLVLFVAGTLLVGRDRIPPPPSQRPSAQPGFRCEDFTPCGGDLEAGAHRSSIFRPSAAYEVPARWRNLNDRSDYYAIDTLEMPAPRIDVMSEQAIPEQGPDCTVTLREGVSDSVQDWVTFLTTHPGLIASEPETVALGGQTAVRVTVTRARTWTQTCGDGPEPIVVLMTDRLASPHREWWMGGSAVTLTIVDADGQTVLIVVESIFPETHQRRLEAALPIVESFRFGPGG